MTKRIVTECDICNGDNGADATTHEITIDGRSISVDLCASDKETWLDNVWEALVEVGRPVPKKASPRGGAGQFTSQSGRTYYMRKCPDCDFQAKNSSGLSSHRKAAHGRVVESPSNVTKIRSTKKTPNPFVCDESDCGRAFKNPQGLGAHKFRAHGIAGTSKRRAS